MTGNITHTHAAVPMAAYTIVLVAARLKAGASVNP